ncbi:DNA-binding protein H-NS [Vibrio astriarenae]|nr:DNA-binding protein H-NS [Vibrio sp. C7]
MQDVIKKLTSMRQAKSVLKQATPEQLTRIIDTLMTLKEDKEQQAKLDAEREEKERLELELMRQQILDKGLDFDKLASLMKPKKKPRKSQSATSKRYVYGDDDATWDGKGEVPKALQLLLDEGFELSDFLVTS